MSTEELRRRVTAVPFRPFIVNVADGRRIPVIGQGFISISSSGRIIEVYQRDDGEEILDCLMITGLSFAPTTEVPAAE